jgi:hypothetical protein
MITKAKPISVRLSIDAHIAWYFLKDKKVTPGKYLREGGEIYLITQAKKFGLKYEHVKITKLKELYPNLF